LQLTLQLDEARNVISADPVKRQPKKVPASDILRTLGLSPKDISTLDTENLKDTGTNHVR
jgi:hypothetical protein